MAGGRIGWGETLYGRGSGVRDWRLRVLGRCGGLTLPGRENEGEEGLAGSRTGGAYALGVALRTNAIASSRESGVSVSSGGDSGGKSPWR